jgi:hypothetical protein
MSALDDARAFIEASRWQFARSQPWLPHEYTLRKWHEADATVEAFEAMILRIRDHGEVQPFGKKQHYTYYVVDGWRYWSMGDPALPADAAWMADRTIINRAQCDEEGRPLFGPKWLTGRDPKAPDPPCCALGEATGGAHHGKYCDRDQLRLDVA